MSRSFLKTVKQPQTWTRLYMALSVVYTRSAAGFPAIARWRVVTISFAQLFPCSTSLGATSPCTPGRPSAIHYEDNRETKLRATNNVFSEKRVRVCWTWDQSRAHFLHVYNNRKEFNWALQVITNPNKSACCTICFVCQLHCMFFRHYSVEGWYNVSFDTVLQLHNFLSTASIYSKSTIHHSSTNAQNSNLWVFNNCFKPMNLVMVKRMQEKSPESAFYKQPQTWTRLYMALSVVYTRSTAGFSAIAWWRVVAISFAMLVPGSTSLGATSPCTPGRPSAVH